MKKSKGVVIAISIVLILAIVAATFAYLFFMTDVLKSNEELFIKYFAPLTTSSILNSVMV